MLVRPHASRDAVHDDADALNHGSERKWNGGSAGDSMRCRGGRPTGTSPGQDIQHVGLNVDGSMRACLLRASGHVLRPNFMSEIPKTYEPAAIETRWYA